MKTVSMSILFYAAVLLSSPLQVNAESAAWFGLTLPPSLGLEPAVVVGDRNARSVQGEAASSILRGEAIRKDLETIVAFSHESRRTREIGSGQLWGRVSGLPSSEKTVEWAAAQFRAAGIKQVEVQAIQQEAQSRLWLPLEWEVRLLGDAAFGAGSQDVVLSSALPLAPSQVPGGTLTAPLQFVGGANPALLNHIDVRGKIAVQLIVPQGHTVFERGVVNARSQDLIKRGAVAVLNLVRLPGNELARDFGNCGGACFNIGGRDGWFLEQVLDKASQAGLKDKVQARLSLKAESKNGLSARNAVAVIPGKSAETILIDAHVDAWFDGAGDNADGLAVMVALARHFANSAKPERTLVFIASAGHHTPGINGPRAFVAANPELVKQAALVINIEHVAQRNFSPGRSTASDGFRRAVADVGEAPIVFGVSNNAPVLNQLAQVGVSRFGVNFSSEPSTMQSGETGGFADVRAGKITIMQAPPLYHTSGETLDVISTPGLERMARFLVYFIGEVARAKRGAINPEQSATPVARPVAD